MSIHEPGSKEWYDFMADVLIEKCDTLPGGRRALYDGLRIIQRRLLEIIRDLEITNPEVMEGE